MSGCFYTFYLNYSEIPNSSNRIFNRSNLPVLERFFNMPHIIEKSFADAGFGIDDVAAANNGERDLPTVP